jgi:uncharacterized RDD family membrane protein YckC
MASSWKQEVSLRIAAHKSRRGYSNTPPAAPAPTWTAASSRAAAALARVAARYASAPSYSQMQAAETSAVIGAGTVAAFEPQKEELADEPLAAAFESAEPRPPEPEDLHAEESVRSFVRDREPAVASLYSAAPSSLEEWENERAYSRWEPDLRLRPVEPVLAPVQAPAAQSEPCPVEELTSSFSDPSDSAKWDWPELVRDLSSGEEIEPVEPDLPIHANLIEFPRELVATRKMRPRRAEGPFAARTETQLSIFEVDPGAVSTRPEAAAAAAVAAWPEPAWAEIELEPQLREETEAEETLAALQELQQAPIGRRLVAALVDGALLAAILLGPALIAAGRIGHSHPTKIVELGAILGFLAAGMLYHALCLLLAGATPGMNLAGISLCTFDGQIPTRDQLRSRLGALLLSLVPVGLGVAWALFDEDRLCWHDRLSKTYLRQN